MLYAKSTNGFYIKSHHRENIPADAVEITEERHAELLDEQSRGKKVVSDANGFPIVVAIPDAIPEYFTYKTDIWQRTTTEEAETLDAALNNAPAQERRMWNDSITIEHSSSYYATLREQIVAAFGEQRADILLAPSNKLTQ